MKGFTIQRSRWIRGYLCDPADENHMDCLGFFLSSLGIPSDSLRGLNTPEQIKALPESLGKLPDNAKFLVEQVSETCVVDSSFTNVLVGINDHPVLSDTDREEQIAKMFAGQGFKVYFID